MAEMEQLDDPLPVVSLDELRSNLIGYTWDALSEKACIYVKGIRYDLIHGVSLGFPCLGLAVGSKVVALRRLTHGWEGRPIVWCSKPAKLEGCVSSFDYGKLITKLIVED